MTQQQDPLEQAISGLRAELSPANGTIVLPNGRQVQLERPLEALSESGIADVLQATFADPGIRGYERLMLLNITGRQQQRLRQELGNPVAPNAARLSNAYWQTFYEYI